MKHNLSVGCRSLVLYMTDGRKNVPLGIKSNFLRFSMVDGLMVVRRRGCGGRVRWWMGGWRGAVGGLTLPWSY